jgi:hypothetical protein
MSRSGSGMRADRLIHSAARASPTEPGPCSGP